jgi:hypothetical protein
MPSRSKVDRSGPLLVACFNAWLWDDAGVLHEATFFDRCNRNLLLDQVVVSYPYRTLLQRKYGLVYLLLTRQLYQTKRCLSSC